MTTITLELPDEVATQFRVDPQQLHLLLREAIETKWAKLSPANDESANEAEKWKPIYQELVDFLSSSPTTEQIIAFKISDEAQQRLEDLLHKNRETALKQAEQTELETYLQVSHIVTRLKARARGGQPFIN